MTSTRYSSSLGGGLSTISALDWKFAAVQQIGLIMSKKFASVEESFLDAAQNQERVDFGKFEAFVERTQALGGFNMTRQLM
jgi:hypothetical protein